jgi:uncharacterized protein (DUF1499 family)
VAGSVEDATEAVVEAVATLPRWSGATRTDSVGRVQLAFVYTTGIFRFRDDVTVWIEPVADGARIRARSASRVGGADLGQNPRTLRALMGAIREQLGSPPG